MKLQGKSLGSGPGFMVILTCIIMLAGCSGGGNKPNNSPLTYTTSQKAASLQMTTFCENDPATTLQFNFAQNIGDGAGITFGCIGFTTGTYSGNILIHYYTTLNPNNTLAKYIPALDRIDGLVKASGTKSNDTTGLDNFINDVRNCTDPLFKKAQLHVLDQMYWNPAVAAATNIGAKYALTLAFIYDMCVNHGDEGAQRLIDQTTAAMGGSPATGISERQWLTKCISIRSGNFPGGADRHNAFLRVLNSGNVNLTLPFPFTVYGDTCTINGNVGI